MKTIAIHTEYIQLDQLLKWADITSTGGQVKMMLDEEDILVNDIVCKEKRKKIYPSYIVTIKSLDISIQVVREEE